jgi:hypothetical protein
MPKTSISLEIERDLGYFPIEITLNDKDKQEPIVFAPHFINIEEYNIPKEQEELLWHLFKKNNNIAENEGETELSYTETLDYINPSSYVRVIKLSNDNNEPTKYKTPKLSVIRFGLATFRVYGPDKSLFWKGGVCGSDDSSGDSDPTVTGQTESTVEIDLYKDEKMLLLSATGEPQKKVDLMNFDISLKSKKFGGHEDSLFDFERLSKVRGSFVELNTIVTFRGKSFNRSWIIPANRDDPAMLNSAPGKSETGNRQFKKVGRKKDTIQELLTFSGETQKTVKYWYDVKENTWSEENHNPAIRILEWTGFVDWNGEAMSDPNASIEDKNSYPKNLNPQTLKYGHTFFAPCPCWGSMLVEYDVHYTEYTCYYETPNPIREFEVSAGQISKVGYCTYSKGGDLIEYCAFDALSVNLEGFGDEEYGENSTRQVLIGMDVEDIQLLFAENRINFVGRKDGLGKRNVVITPATTASNDDEPTVARKKHIESQGENPPIYILRDPDEGDDGVTLVIYDNLSFKKLKYDDMRDILRIQDICAYELFKSLRFSEFKHTPYIAIATNGVRTTDVSFNPPSPNFLDFSEREMPKSPIFYQYVREEVYPDPSNLDFKVEIDHAEEIIFIDPYGNITTESLTSHAQENEARIAEIQEELDKRKAAFDAQKEKEREEQDRLSETLENL